MVLTEDHILIKNLYLHKVIVVEQRRRNFQLKPEKLHWMIS